MQFFNIIYYDQQEKKIYEGSIKDEMPENWDNEFIDNNYYYLIYKRIIKNGAYNRKGIEFSNVLKI